MPDKYPLAVGAERADVAHKIAHDFAFADFLRIVGGEDDAGRGDFAQAGFDCADAAGKSGGVEHEVVADVIVEVVLRRHAVAWVAGGSPKFLVLKTSDPRQHGSDAAGEMRHVHGQFGMAVEHAGIDQADGRHDQRELAADAARGVVGVELFGAIEF